MDLDDIKRGLRAEIKKRENEQYATFQCNVRQMCKDVLAKLEEQESGIAELQKQVHDYAQGLYVIQARADKDARHHKYKRCLAMHDYCLCELEFAFRDPCIERSIEGCIRWRKWVNLWLELAKKFKEA